MKKINLSLGSIDTVVGVCENCENDTVFGSCGYRLL